MWPVGSVPSRREHFSQVTARCCPSIAPSVSPPVSGKRARRYLQRQHLLDLWPAALAYLTELTHRRPQIWIHDVERLHGLLQTHGEAALRRAFERGLAEPAIGAEYIAHYLGDISPALPFDPEGDRPPTVRRPTTFIAPQKPVSERGRCRRLR